MAATTTQFESAEGILLIRRDGATMAVHLTGVMAFLEAVVVERDLDLGYVTHYHATLDHYDVEVQATADRIYMWVGPDPFDKPGIENPRAEVEA